MDEARSVSYSINVRANTSQAEASIRNVTSSLGDLQGSGGRINISADSSQADSSIRNVTSNLGGLQSQASSVGSAFRSSFLAGVDGGNTFSSSLRSGVGGAFSYVMGQANAFKRRGSCPTVRRRPRDKSAPTNPQARCWTEYPSAPRCALFGCAPASRI